MLARGFRRRAPAGPRDRPDVTRRAGATRQGRSRGEARLWVLRSLPTAVMVVVFGRELREEVLGRNCWWLVLLLVSRVRGEGREDDGRADSKEGRGRRVEGEKEEEESEPKRVLSGEVKAVVGGRESREAREEDGEEGFRERGRSDRGRSEGGVRLRGWTVP